MRVKMTRLIPLISIALLGLIGRDAAADPDDPGPDSPRLTGATTEDRDNNGHIDHLTLTFSKPVRSDHPHVGLQVTLSNFGSTLPDYVVDGNTPGTNGFTTTITIRLFERHHPARVPQRPTVIYHHNHEG